MVRCFCRGAHLLNISSLVSYHSSNACCDGSVSCKWSAAGFVRLSKTARSSKVVELRAMDFETLAITSKTLARVYKTLSGVHQTSCRVHETLVRVCGKAGACEEAVEQDKPEVIEGKPLREVSTWGIGGPAKYFMEAHSEAQMASLLRHCHRNDIRVIVIGKGSNCLFDDLGFDGCVILNRIDYIESSGDGVYRVGSGHAFNKLGVYCSKEGYTGLEFACGIPGTVGGAVYMNAGANGQDVAGVLRSVEILTSKGEKLVFWKGQGVLEEYGYRRSPFQTLESLGAIIAATFELWYDPEASKMYKDLLRQRKASQPLTEKSAGSVFRNPSNSSNSAGALIDQAGLKGFSIGDAKVSEMHANFLVNLGKSTSADMLSLIALVKEQVRFRFDVELQEEIKYIPYR